MATATVSSYSTTGNTSSTEESFNSAFGDIVKDVLDYQTTTDSKKKNKNAHRDNGNGTNLLYAANKNAAEGLMDIALLSANANQLRFLLTYNHKASTFYISLTLVAISLILQVLVGIALIFKRHFHCCRNKRYNEFVIGGVFIITVVNILLAAFTTTTTTDHK